MAKFEDEIGALLVREGGYVNNPKDPGGETKYGISKRAYPNLDIKGLTKEDAVEIYRRDYWGKLGLDSKSSASAHAALDIAVHSGVERARSALNAAGDNPSALVDNHSKFLTKLVQDNPSKYGEFDKGWKNRIVSLRNEVDKRIPLGAPQGSPSVTPVVASVDSPLGLQDIPSITPTEASPEAPSVPLPTALATPPTVTSGPDYKSLIEPTVGPEAPGYVQQGAVSAAEQASITERKQREYNARTGFFGQASDAFAAALERSSQTKVIREMFDPSKGIGDPNDAPGSDEFAKMVQDVPGEFREYIAEGGTRLGIQERMRRVTEILNRSEDAQHAGTGATILGALSAGIGEVVNAGPSGVIRAPVQALSKLRQAGHALKQGASVGTVAGAGNVLLESGGYTDPRYGEAFLEGLGFGGVLGGLAGAAARPGIKAAYRETLPEIVDGQRQVQTYTDWSKAENGRLFGETEVSTSDILYSGSPAKSSTIDVESPYVPSSQLDLFPDHQGDLFGSSKGAPSDTPSVPQERRTVDSPVETEQRTFGETLSRPGPLQGGIPRSDKRAGREITGVFSLRESLEALANGSVDRPGALGKLINATGETSGPKSKLAARLLEAIGTDSDRAVVFGKGIGKGGPQAVGSSHIRFPVERPEFMRDEVLLHEAAHLATTEKIVALVDGSKMGTLSVEQIEVMGRLRAVQDGIKQWTRRVSPDARLRLQAEPSAVPGQSAWDRLEYVLRKGDEGVMELVGVVFEGTPGFLRTLNDIPLRFGAVGETRSILSRLWDAVADILGMGAKEGTALHELLRGVDDLLDMNLKTTADDFNPKTGKAKYRTLVIGPGETRVSSAPPLSSIAEADEAIVLGAVPLNPIPSESLRNHLADMINNAPEATKATKALGARLLKGLQDDVRVIVSDDPKVHARYGSTPDRAVFDADSGTIVLPETMRVDNPGEFYATLLHEAAHARTAARVSEGIWNPGTREHALVKELDALRKEVVRQLGLTKEFDPAGKLTKEQHGHFVYHLMGGDFAGEANVGRWGTTAHTTALQEFVAGLYTPVGSFYKALDGVKVGNRKSALSKSWEVLRDLLGFTDSETSALRAAMRIVDEIIDLPRKGIAENAQGVPTWSLNSAPIDTLKAAAAGGVDRSLVFGVGLGLSHRLMNKRVMQPARDLALKLIGSTEGLRDHSVIQSSAWDETLKHYTGWSTSAKEVAHKAFGEYKSKNGIKFTDQGTAWNDFNAAVDKAMRGGNVDIPEIAPVVAHYRKLLDNDVRELINNPLKDRGGVMLGLTESEVLDPETGAKTIVGALEKRDNYMPRSYDSRKWDSMVQRHGRQAVVDFFAGAHRSANPGVDPEVSLRVGRWITDSFEAARLNNTSDSFGDLLEGRNVAALKQSMVDHGGIPPGEVEEIINAITRTVPDRTGRPVSNLKNRTLFDESFRSGQGISLHDLIDTNASRVMEGYLRRMAGAIGLASATGARTTTEYAKLIKDATEVKLGDNIPGQTVDTIRGDLQFAIDQIMGRPVESKTKTLKALEMFRAFNVVRLMSGAVFNQIVESSQIAGSMGYKVMTEAMPAFRQIMSDIKAGAADEDVASMKSIFQSLGADDVAKMDFSESDDWARLLGEGKYATHLDRTSDVLQKSGHQMLRLTGMSPLHTMQKRFHAVAFLEHIKRVADNGEESILFTKDRLAWMGFTETEFATLLGTVKGSKVNPIAALKDNPELQSKLRIALQRESRRVVQENDLSSMIPIMGKGLAKTMFQFQSFAFHAWSKSLLFGLNHRDTASLLTVAYGSMIAALAYSVRSALQVAGKSEEERERFLNERFSAKQIVASSFGRLAQASLAPQIFDTLSPWPLFAGMRTTADVSDLAANPTLQLVNGALSGMKLVRNAVSGTEQTSAADVRALSRLLPLNNLVGIQNVLNAVASEFPSSGTQTE